MRDILSYGFFVLLATFNVGRSWEHGEFLWAAGFLGIAVVTGLALVMRLWVLDQELHNLRGLIGEDLKKKQDDVPNVVNPP
ncbi:MAG: hypothetical protein UY76_C0015G0010 [Candidatus Uhrbacteria bacterium GW2011_GWA2_52_8d]|uniref:Uncharacterized protein n=1 Tax=Candidatus Uhrbacteria bacterium GW2011_GWA2_52_8d TaxID=1618979 RepID=A0A0G2AJT9_9BACT|nr:MAG: hypothetical protein UY76_C0015G0010 [Candidatus Uhrbacteria bacterium GW2011_GWA2_52_8d]